jgi:hypothetical protein
VNRYDETICRGEKSIQAAINMLAKQTGNDWAKKITNNDWREAVRVKLQEKSNEWCDYRVGTCACKEVA